MLHVEIGSSAYFAEAVEKCAQCHNNISVSVILHENQWSGYKLYNDQKKVVSFKSFAFDY